MDSMSSAQFRKQYAKLTEPTIVTVSGHAIGVWNPSSAKGIAAVRDWAGPVVEQIVIGPDAVHSRRLGSGEPWSTRPFTPVPKKGK